MQITKSNLNQIIFENEDARLLILDVVSNTSATLYYYHDHEITVQEALRIYQKAHEADEKKNDPFTKSWLSKRKLQRELIPA